MKKLVVVLVGVLVVAVSAVGSGFAKPSRNIVGQVYVNDNTAGVNTVAGFNRHADGSLSPIPGSPFQVGGAGTGKGTASQGALQLSADGRFLFAVDAASNQISVLRIERDGSLDSADGSPVASGGVNPVSIAVSGKLVYVANQGPGTNPGDANYTGFKFSDGHLNPIDGSTVALPSDAVPGQVLFNADGTKLVGTRIGSSEIDSFIVVRHGRLLSAHRLAVRGAGVLTASGVRSARQRVQPDESRPALRVGRPCSRGRPGAGTRLELHR